MAKRVTCDHFETCGGVCVPTFIQHTAGNGLMIHCYCSKDQEHHTSCNVLRFSDDKLTPHVTCVDGVQTTKYPPFRCKSEMCSLVDMFMSKGDFATLDWMNTIKGYSYSYYYYYYYYCNYYYHYYYHNYLIIIVFIIIIILLSLLLLLLS